MAQTIKGRTALFGLILILIAGPASAQPSSKPSGSETGYPEAVALSQEGSLGWVYRRFPGGQRLYVFDLDKNGASECNKNCEGAHNPVYAAANARAMTAWTIVARYDNTRQWAYKGRPVYTLYHDDPGRPTGDGEGGLWHVMPYSATPEMAANVQSGEARP